MFYALQKSLIHETPFERIYYSRELVFEYYISIRYSFLAIQFPILLHFLAKQMTLVISYRY